jgi:hypothetical protein
MARRRSIAPSSPRGQLRRTAHYLVGDPVNLAGFEMSERIDDDPCLGNIDLAPGQCVEHHREALGDFEGETECRSGSPASPRQGSPQLIAGVFVDSGMAFRRGAGVARGTMGKFGHGFEGGGFVVGNLTPLGLNKHHQLITVQHRPVDPCQCGRQFRARGHRGEQLRQHSSHSGWSGDPAVDNRPFNATSW